MLLDKRGFDTAMPLLYEDAVEDLFMARYLTRHDTPFVSRCVCVAIDRSSSMMLLQMEERFSRYIHATKRLEVPGDHEPSPQLFARYQASPALEWLSGRSDISDWKLYKPPGTEKADDGSEIPRQIELSLAFCNTELYDASEADTDEGGTLSSPWDITQRIIRAVALGLRLVNLGVSGDGGPAAGRAATFAELLGGPEIAAGLTEFRWSLGYYMMTWSDLHDLSRACPNLRSLSVTLTNFSEFSWFGRPAGVQGLEGGALPRFPYLTHLKLQHGDGGMVTEGEAGQPVVLDFRALLSLEYLCVTLDTPYFGLLGGGGGGAAWQTGPTAEDPSGVQVLEVNLDSRMVDMSPLRVARCLANRFHPRCRLRCADQGEGSHLIDGRAAQWMRDVAVVRDEVVNEDVLDMRVGWRNVTERSGKAQVEAEM